MTYGCGDLLWLDYLSICPLVFIRCGSERFSLNWVRNSGVTVMVINCFLKLFYHQRGSQILQWSQFSLGTGWNGCFRCVISIFLVLLFKAWKWIGEASLNFDRRYLLNCWAATLLIRFVPFDRRQVAGKSCWRWKRMSFRWLCVATRYGFFFRSNYFLVRVPRDINCHRGHRVPTIAIRYLFAELPNKIRLYHVSAWIKHKSIWRLL
jgi:hypothetical protein